MGRLIAAVAAGFLSMTVLVLATEVVLRRVFFHASLSEMSLEPIPVAYFVANIVSGLVYSILGGCITAAIGKRPEAPTILGALMLGMGIGNLIMTRGGEPLWYAILIPLIDAVVATFAGYAWLGRAERK